MTIYDLSLGGGLAPLSRFTNLLFFFFLGLTSCRRWDLGRLFFFCKAKIVSSLFLSFSLLLVSMIS